MLPSAFDAFARSSSRSGDAAGLAREVCLLDLQPCFRPTAGRSRAGIRTEAGPSTARSPGSRPRAVRRPDSKRRCPGVDVAWLPARAVSKSVCSRDVVSSRRPGRLLLLAGVLDRLEMACWAELLLSCLEERPGSAVRIGVAARRRVSLVVATAEGGLSPPDGRPGASSVRRLFTHPGTGRPHGRSRDLPSPLRAQLTKAHCPLPAPVGAERVLGRTLNPTRSPRAWPSGPADWVRAAPDLGLTSPALTTLGRRADFCSLGTGGLRRRGPTQSPPSGFARGRRQTIGDSGVQEPHGTPCSLPRLIVSVMSCSAKITVREPRIAGRASGPLASASLPVFLSPSRTSLPPFPLPRSVRGNQQKRWVSSSSKRLFI